MNSDKLLIKTQSSKIRNSKILDLIFDLTEKKQDVINTFDLNELNQDKKDNQPIFIDFKKLHILNIDPTFLWNLYSYKTSMKVQHEKMKLSYFLWCIKTEEVFMELLQAELKNNIKYPFILIINSLINNYKFDRYSRFYQENIETINNILEHYLILDNAKSFVLKNETCIPKTNISIFKDNNIKYINKALNIYFLNLIQ